MEINFILSIKDIFLIAGKKVDTYLSSLGQDLSNESDPLSRSRAEYYKDPDGQKC